MKKILAILLVLCFVFSFAACSNGEGDNNSSLPDNNNSVITSSDESSQEEKGELVLDGEENFVIVIKVGSGLKFEKAEDIEGLKVTGVYESDGQKIADYYGAIFYGQGASNDVFSGFGGSRDIQCAIVKKSAADVYVKTGKYEIALDLGYLIEK